MKFFKRIFGLDTQEENLNAITKKLDSSLLLLEQSSKEIEALKEFVKPKPAPFNFKLVDPLNTDKVLFSLAETSAKEDGNLESEVENGESIIRNILGSIPELVSAGVVQKSYSFAYPNGIAGQVMRIGSGQGTAIMQNGQIAAHGTYIANSVIALPLAAYSIGSMIIRQHYLNKIHKKLESIDRNLSRLLQLVFLNKRSKIDAIIYFYKQSFNEFDNGCTNESYRNAVLTNLISKNIEVYELIQFYANALNDSSNYSVESNKNDFDSNLKSFLELQDLFLYGKILTFMYSDLFDKDLVQDLKTEFEMLSSLYMKVLQKNEKEIQNVLQENSIRWNDWLVGRRKTKKNIKAQANEDLLSLDAIRNDIEMTFNNGQKMIENVLTEIEKPQEYLIEDGKLYQIALN